MANNGEIAARICIWKAFYGQRPLIGYLAARPSTMALPLDPSQGPLGEGPACTGKRRREKYVESLSRLSGALKEMVELLSLSAVSIRVSGWLCIWLRLIMGSGIPFYTRGQLSLRFLSIRGNGWKQQHSHYWRLTREKIMWPFVQMSQCNVILLDDWVMFPHPPSRTLRDKLI